MDYLGMHNKPTTEVRKHRGIYADGPYRRRRRRRRRRRKCVDYEGIFVKNKPKEL
jgi:hypothetical protein